ncbi:FREM2 [Bugula neritina]|uniref:FREM2 n=1 Tax=Bugula neritina TaxID=10212 RepID=A0A7J7JSI4_BUGNE|nr:FREM2 [Bugula neritina]
MVTVVVRLLPQVQDYTGSYIVKLIPCVVPVDTSYSADAVCTAQQPLTFYLDIELQQVSDPVAKIFSLNTELTLTRNKRAWVTNNRTGEDLSDVAFQSGERIYGRVDTRELNDTALPHEVFVEKVYVCAGKNGFVPKYAPDSQEYGCAAMTGDLQAQYKILDKTNPDSVTKLLNGIPFNAKFAADDKRGKQIHNMPGTDGFMFDSKPLNAELERKWFVHVIYSVDTLTNPLKMIRRFRRAQLTELSGVGHAKGTNMAFLYLTEPNVSSASAKSSPESPTYTWAVAVGVITLLLVLVTLGISLVTVKIIKLKKKKQNRLKESERRDGPESLPMHVDEKRDVSISDSIDGDAVVKLNATVTNSEI